MDDLEKLLGFRLEFGPLDCAVMLGCVLGIVTSLVLMAR